MMGRGGLECGWKVGGEGMGWMEVGGIVGKVDGEEWKLRKGCFWKKGVWR